MENQKGKQLGMYGALILIVAAMAYYLYTDFKKKLPEKVVQNGVSEEMIESITPPTKNIVSMSMPKLNRSIPENTEITSEVRTILAGCIKEWSDKIAKEPNNSESWVFLGVEYKMAEDYEGAREAWEYAAYLSPNSVAHQNLGDLYAYYLHDNAKAEDEFIEAIRLSPSAEYLYFKATEFYRDVLKDLVKARAIVEKGIAANPSSTDLKSLLSSLK